MIEVSTGDGKKPRFVNDYEAPAKISTAAQYLDQIEFTADHIQQMMQTLQRESKQKENQ